MMIRTFAFGKCYGRGALNSFLVVLIMIQTRAALIMKFSLFHALDFQLLPILDFCPHSISVRNVKS